MRHSDRRNFLLSSSLLLFTAALSERGWARALKPGQYGPLPIVQVATTDTMASFVVIHPKNLVFQLRATSSSGTELHHEITAQESLIGLDVTATEICIYNLKVRTEYSLELLNDLGQAFDRRTFKALEIHKKSARFAVVSCMNDRFSEISGDIWNHISSSHPDLVFFIGDTVYSDMSNPDQDTKGYTRRYYETRSKLKWFYQKRLTPSLAVWDDHDFGLNNGNKEFPLKDLTTDLFRKFWGRHRNATYQQGHGVGSLFTAFGQRFFMMDDRSFRDPDSTRNGSHWGENQRSWLLSEINKDSTPCWIFNGSQFFGAYLAKESYEGNHGADFSSFIHQLSKVSAPVCFVSGDVHFSEIMRIEPELLGYETREFTSSSAHSFTAPGLQDRARNIRRLQAHWKHNFMLFETDVSAEWQIKTYCLSSKKDLLFDHKTTIHRT